VRAFDFVTSQPWLIGADHLREIAVIAARAHDGDVDALATRLGYQLENTRTVAIRPNGVAVVPITGPIFRYANMFTAISGATATAILARDIQSALDNPAVSAIVLDIDSPGGAAAGIHELADVIAKGRDRKRIVAYVGNLGASAAYWLATAAHEVVIDATAMVGSVGVVMTYLDTRERDAKSGVREIPIVSSAAPHKRDDPNTDEGRERLQKIVDDMAAVMIESIAKLRGTTPAKVTEDFGKGSVLVGQLAVEAGMADRLGSLEETIAALAPGPTGVTAPAKRTPFTQPAPQPGSGASRLTRAELTAELEIEPAIAAIAADERARIQAILTSALGKDRPALAARLAFQTNASVEIALRTLGTSRPEPKPPHESWFTKAMREHHSPNVPHTEVPWNRKFD
jgi:signal peptide peptidase SppA